MKSKLTIEMDFEFKEPVIKINQVRTDDVRDTLIQFFLEQFGQTSTWCRIDFTHNTNLGEQTAFIRPIKIEDLKKEAELMSETARIIETFN